MASSLFVKYIKLGEFEVEFQDIIDPSNKSGIQFIEKVCTSAVEYLSPKPTGFAIEIDAGYKYFIAYSNTEPMKFIFHKNGTRRETKWYLQHATRLNAYVICNNYPMATDDGYHWKYDAGEKAITLAENFPGYENSAANMFYIDHNVATISPFNDRNMKAIAYDEGRHPPGFYETFQSVGVVRTSSGNVDLTVRVL